MKRPRRNSARNSGALQTAVSIVSGCMWFTRLNVHATGNGRKPATAHLAEQGANQASRRFAFLDLEPDPVVLDRLGQLFARLLRNRNPLLLVAEIGEHGLQGTEVMLAE